MASEVRTQGASFQGTEDRMPSVPLSGGHWFPAVSGVPPNVPKLIFEGSEKDGIGIRGHGFLKFTIKGSEFRNFTLAEA